MAILKKGMKGSAVKALQIQLNKAGAKPKLDVNATFDDKTDEAVRAFQKKSGLKVDGKAGPNTMGALEGGKAAAKPVEWTVKETMRAHKALNAKIDDLDKSCADIAAAFAKFKKAKEIEGPYKTFTKHADAYRVELDAFKKALVRVDFMKTEFDMMLKGDPAAQAKKVKEAEAEWKIVERHNAKAAKLLDPFEISHDQFLEALDTVPA